MPLRGNFRSRPEVLAAVDFAGAALLAGIHAARGAGSRADTASRAAVAPATELLLTDATEDKPGSQDRLEGGGGRARSPPSETSPAYVAEARFLAQRLRELADRGVPRGDMVVLLRAFTHVDAFEEALDRAGLAPYVVGGRGYWSQQQVEDALRLLGVDRQPARRRAPVRRPCLAGLRRQPRRPVAPAPGRPRPRRPPAARLANDRRR